MARGGSRGRRSSYVRDNSGRFASTSGGGPPKRSTPASRRAAKAKVTGGTLGARGSLRRSRAKLAGKNPADRSLRGSLSLRAQRGAVTRGANRLGKVRAASTVRMAGKGPAGVIRGGRKVAGRPVASAAPKDYRRGRSAAAGYKPKTDRTRASSQVGTRAKLSEFQRAEAQTAKQRFGVRSTAQRARMRAGSYDPAKQGGGRQVFRTKAEARKAYLKRAAATKSTASKSYNDGRYAGDGVKTGTKGSARIRTAAVAQGNLLSGKADNVKVRKARSFSGRSALGGAMRRAAAKSAKPVAAPKSSVRVIRPNRPAMRPGPGPERGKISEYVGAVRGARRRLSSAKPGTADAAEAKQGLRDNRQALSRRIQRERGARRGLKPATSQQVLTGTVPAPPARRVKAARPSGTLAKPRNLKPGAIAARKAKAAASGARGARATTNYNRAQKAALEAQQRVNRRRSPKNLAALARADKSLKTAARAYRILVGLGGEKMAVVRKPSPKGAGPRTKAARPAGTVVKPRGLKVGAMKAKTKKTSQKVLTPERIKSANANLKARLTKVLDELRKVDNAKNRDNTPMSSGSNFSPRYQKLIARGAKADRQLESLRKAAKKLKQIELGYTPEKYGFARGTAQRKALAAEIRTARSQLKRLQREETVASRAYHEDPVVKFGLWGEIGQNRKQSRKAKERTGNRRMRLADRYIGLGIGVRQQRSVIQKLRDKAKQQTQETNKRQGSRRKP